MNMDTFGLIFAIITFVVLYTLCGVEVAMCRIRRNENFWNYMDSVPYGDLDYYYKDVKAPKLFGVDCFIFFPALIVLGVYLHLCKKNND